MGEGFWSTLYMAREFHRRLKVNKKIRKSRPKHLTKKQKIKRKQQKEWNKGWDGIF